MIRRFRPDDYYSVYYDDEALHAPYLVFSVSAMQLLARYYQEKYDFHLSFYHNFIDFKANLNRFLRQNSDKQDYRHAFFIGKTGSHAMAIIYFNEQGEQGFLCADSLGAKVSRVFHQGKFTTTIGGSKVAAGIIKSLTSVPAYIVSEQRQADLYSCDIDTFVMARDCCGKRKGAYLLPGLLAELKTGAQEVNGYLEVKLKTIFLKLVQVNSFFKQHPVDPEAIVHHHQGKAETLPEFMRRYGDDAQENKRPIPSYLRLKKIKMANIIEIRSYVEELRLKYKGQWSKDIEKQFIALAKEELYQQWPITINRARKGLCQFASQYVPAELEHKPSESYVSRQHSVETPQGFVSFARQLIEIILDQEYWQGKSDEGIILIQEKLRDMKAKTLEAQFNAVRMIAGRELSKKSVWYLWFSLDYETRDPMVLACYSIFREDLQDSASFKKLLADWTRFKNVPSKVQEEREYLPSMEIYKRTRVRF